MEKLTATFTGHRPNKIYGYNEKARDKYKALVRELQTMIENLYNIGVRNFITGGAQGFDQLVFWAIYNQQKVHPDIKNIVYVPFKHQHIAWSEKGLFGQSEYHAMLSRADEIKNVAEENGKPTATNKDIVKALLDRNKEMVKDADILVGFYSHESDFLNDTGGTAHCLRHAHNNNDIAMYLFDPETFKIKTIRKK